MLAKVLGSALILGSTSYVGWQVAARYARRPRELRGLSTALSVLQTEIEYGCTPLPEALRAAAHTAEPAIAPFFTETAMRLEAGGGITAGEAMREAVAAVASNTALRESDQEVLYALAAILGSSGRLDQVRHLRLALERLAGEEARAIEERSRYERVAKYAGVLSGAALVLIFL